MIPEDELRHLRSGPDPWERPGGVGTVEFEAQTKEDPREVLSLVRQVLEAIVQHQRRPWPDLVAWRTLLPARFVEAFAPEPTDEEIAQRQRRRQDTSEAQALVASSAWSLGDWLFWLQPEERQWYWWHGVIAEGLIRISVQIDGWPTPFGALEWLLHAAGASEVREVV